MTKKFMISFHDLMVAYLQTRARDNIYSENLQDYVRFLIRKDMMSSRGRIYYDSLAAEMGIITNHAREK